MPNSKQAETGRQVRYALPTKTNAPSITLSIPGWRRTHAVAPLGSVAATSPIKPNTTSVIKPSTQPCLDTMFGTTTKSDKKYIRRIHLGGAANERSDLDPSAIALPPFRTWAGALWQRVADPGRCWKDVARG
ncbi:hypothetical protein JCM18899A_46840 [Nocardioides sp. AN3]